MAYHIWCDISHSDMTCHISVESVLALAHWYRNERGIEIERALAQCGLTCCQAAASGIARSARKSICYVSASRHDRNMILVSKWWFFQVLSSFLTSESSPDLPFRIFCETWHAFAYSEPLRGVPEWLVRYLDSGAGWHLYATICPEQHLS